MYMEDQIAMQYEDFEGNRRKLAELIGQLELWSDEYTINHKKEEIRLPEYVELHCNLEALKQELFEFIKNHEQDGKADYLVEAKEDIKARLTAYEITEKTIHEWIRDIKDVYILMAKSPVLEENRGYLEAVLENK